MIITEFSKCRLDIATTIGVYPLESNVSILMVSSSARSYPLNLSISLGGGEESNYDGPSNGE